MKMLTTLCLVTFACLAVAGANAAVLSRDWKTPGDGLLTYDDVNQREWLDLTASRLSMFPGPTKEDRYLSALAALGPGGLFEGFQVARGDDLVAFAQSAGIDTTSRDDFVFNEPPTRALIDLVGASFSNQSSGFLDAIGKLDEVGHVSSFTFRFNGELFIAPQSSEDGDAGLVVFPNAASDLSTPQNTGIWLFRGVPEPNPATMLVIGLVTIYVRSRRAQQVIASHSVNSRQSSRVGAAPTIWDEGRRQARPTRDQGGIRWTGS